VRILPARHNARISLRQLAEQAGVSNPYLSQIERGLRKPSAEVLQQLANALRVSTPLMYLRAGLLERGEGQGVLAAVANDPDLTESQKQTLTQIYETFKRENARDAAPAAGIAGSAAGVAATGPAAAGPASANGHARPTKTTPSAAARRTDSATAKNGAVSKKVATSMKTVADAAKPKKAVKTATKEK